MDIAKEISQYWYDASERERLEWLSLYAVEPNLADLELVDVLDELSWQDRRGLEQDLAEHVM